MFPRVGAHALDEMSCHWKGLDPIGLEGQAALLHGEIAQRLDFPLPKVQSRLRRILNGLQQQMRGLAQAG